MRTVLAGCCALALLAASGPALAQTKDKKTEAPPPQTAKLGGKTIGQWVTEFNATKDPSKAENAIRTILLFGPEPAQAALPHLLAILRKHTTGTTVDLSVRVNSVIAIGYILGNTRVDQKYVTDAVTLLTRMLRDSERIVRYRAAESLGFIGTPARSAVPDLIATTRDPATFETRQAAAFALGYVAGDAKNGPSTPVLQALYRLLKDSSFLVRMTAVHSLAQLGPPADKTARLALEKELEPVASSDADATVQIWAHMAIMSIKQQVDDTRVSAISKLLFHHELSVRLQAAQALGGLGKQGKKSVPQLQAALEDADPGVVGLCIVALARMGKDASPAIERLRQIAADPQQHEVMKRSAQEALDYIEGRKTEKGVQGAGK